MAAVFRRQRGNEGGPPARHKAVVRIERAKTRKPRAHEPQFGIHPGDLMHANIPGDMRRARDVASVVLADWLNAGRDVRRVAELPDGIASAKREPAAID